MPSITINGREFQFKPGQNILQVASEAGVEIPQYCYHDSLSVVASCRICLAEIWAPNPRNDDKLEPYMGGKLMPTCQTPAMDGMVVRADSPKSVANQKAVMEYLLINHPLDCPVCDQSGECFLQDYSYHYGRGVSRFQEQKVKQPKKDVGPHIMLYADRCIMCTRCVRFTREVTGTNELIVQGRGDRTEIDVFPGKALDNELSANVVDLCPVGALLDKDFLFAQRVWFLRSTPTVDGITASGDNVWAEHNEGKVYRFRPRTNMAINKWWITDEVRYGWKFVHSENRIPAPHRRRQGTLVQCGWTRAYREALEGINPAVDAGRRLAVLISPMLTCEDAYALARMARSIDPEAVLGVGPVPRLGQDKLFPPSADPEDDNAFVMHAEKAPNARGVRRVLEAVAGDVPDAAGFTGRLSKGRFGAVILTGNYPSAWATGDFQEALRKARAAGAGPGGGLFVALADTLWSDLAEHADVVLPAATWLEKAGTFENARGILQAFPQAVPEVEQSKSEGQIALDLQALAEGSELALPGGRSFTEVDSQPGMVAASRDDTRPRAALFNAGDVRAEMAERFEALRVMVTDVAMAVDTGEREGDMEVVEL